MDCAPTISPSFTIMLKKWKWCFQTLTKGCLRRFHRAPAGDPNSRCSLETSQRENSAKRTLDQLQNQGSPLDQCCTPHERHGFNAQAEGSFGNDGKNRGDDQMSIVIAVPNELKSELLNIAGKSGYPSALAVLRRGNPGE